MKTIMVLLISTTILTLVLIFGVVACGDILNNQNISYELIQPLKQILGRQT